MSAPSEGTQSSPHSKRRTGDDSTTPRYSPNHEDKSRIERLEAELERLTNTVRLLERRVADLEVGVAIEQGRRDTNEADHEDTPRSKAMDTPKKASMVTARGELRPGSPRVNKSIENRLESRMSTVDEKVFLGRGGGDKSENALDNSMAMASEGPKKRQVESTPMDAPGATARLSKKSRRFGKTP
ncbi:hypothetical protein FRC09_008533 [Ceratobasidium sp. 395]|nr:hypothetical protein FRC09_008533 [Ceratobasidium sp. 395]